MTAKTPAATCTLGRTSREGESQSTGPGDADPALKHSCSNSTYAADYCVPIRAGGPQTDRLQAGGKPEQVRSARSQVPTRKPRRGSREPSGVAQLVEPLVQRSRLVLLGRLPDRRNAGRHRTRSLCGGGGGGGGVHVFRGFTVAWHRRLTRSFDRNGDINRHRRHSGDGCWFMAWTDVANFLAYRSKEQVRHNRSARLNWSRPFTGQQGTLGPALQTPRDAGSRYFAPGRYLTRLASCRTAQKTTAKTRVRLTMPWTTTDSARRHRTSSEVLAMRCSQASIRLSPGQPRGPSRCWCFWCCCSAQVGRPRVPAPTIVPRAAVPQPRPRSKSGLADPTLWVG